MAAPKSFKVYTGLHQSPWEVLRHFLWELFLFVLTLVILPFFLPISLIFRIYRHTLIHMIKKRCHGDVEIMDGDDAIWLQDSPQNPAVINGMFMIQGTPDVDLFRKIFTDRLANARDDEGNLLCPKFLSYPSKILHRAIWVRDENFDVANHVYMWDGPPPQTRAEIQTLVSELCSTPLPPKRSQWEAVIIPKSPTPEGEEEVHYMMLRAHHSMADGISLLRLLLQKLMDVHPKDVIPQRFGSRGKVWRAIKGIFSGPAIIVDRLTWKSDHHILHGPKLSGQKLLAWSDHIDLDLVKRIKEATGTTVNDVIMSCLARAFRDYLKKYASEVPQNLLAYVPVDIRSPSEKFEMNNQFALVFLNLPTNFDDSLQCLRETKIRMDKIKNSAEPLVNALIITYSMARFPNWLTKTLFDTVSSKCSMVLSNVPGPQHQLFLGRKPIEAMIFWPPQRTNVGIGVSIFSYNGNIKVGVQSDKLIMTNPGLLCDQIVRTFYDLAEEVGVLEGPDTNGKE